jgi:hypothetical protein
MKQIRRHKISINNLDWTFKAQEMLHNNLLNSITENPDKFGALYSNCLDGFAYEFVLRNDKEKAKYYLHIAFQAITAHFRLASFPDQELLIQIGNNEIKTKSYIVTDRINPIDWRIALALSVIFSDMDNVSFLLTVPESVMRKSTIIGDAYNFKYVEFLKSLWDKKKKDTAQCLLDVFDAIEEKNLKIENHNTVLQLVYPQLAMYGAYLDNDSKEFNIRLEQALTEWKKSQEISGGNHPWSFVNIIVASIVKIGKEKGFSIEVESDYIPEELTNGKWKI